MERALLSAVSRSVSRRLGASPPCSRRCSFATMHDMSEDDSAARLDLWWQGLTAEEQSEFRDLKMGDPFPRKHLSAYSRASLVVGARETVSKAWTIA